MYIVVIQYCHHYYLFTYFELHLYKSGSLSYLFLYYIYIATQISKIPMIVFSKFIFN